MHDGFLSVGGNVGAELGEFADQAVAGVVDALSEVAGARRLGGQSHQRGLQVGGEARVGVGDDVDRVQRAEALHEGDGASGREVDAPPPVQRVILYKTSLQAGVFAGMTSTM